MSKISLPLVHSWITRAAIEHPKTLSREVCSRFAISTTAAAKLLKKLTDSNWLVRHGTNRPSYEPGFNRWIPLTLPLPVHNEDLVWQREFLPYLDLSKNVDDLAFYCFTEILNNATDHSGGTEVQLSVRRYKERTAVWISDNGIGIFKKIAQALNLEDLRFALLELSKGKLTTDPRNHSGEGIFFSSRMCDNFEIEANGLEYFHTSASHLDVLEDKMHEKGPGTNVWMWFRNDTTRTQREIFNNFSSSQAGFTFDKTIVPVKLADIGEERLASRSQAKRLSANFERFRIVSLDFTGVTEIGQAFADQLFRVFANSHPEIHLLVVNATPEVQQMIDRAKNTKVIDSQNGDAQ